MRRGGLGQHGIASVLVLTIVLQCLVADASTRGCRLQNLQLRSADEPVDLIPMFSPDHYKYEATLDFGMVDFSTEAVASKGCVTDGIPNQAVSVKKGDAYPLTVYAKGQDSYQAYTVRITRLRGSETDLQDMRIEGATLNPGFYPSVRSYEASLDLDQDFIRLVYVLRDNGQKVRCRASPQVVVPVPSAPEPTPLPPGELPIGGARRLLDVGEVQRWERYQSFPVDVNSRRSVLINIESANPMQADISDYTLVVTRASCNIAKPFYDPLSKACVINCPAKYYSNLPQSRCSQCNTNCAVCRSLAQCELCQKDTLHRSYSMQSDGSCLEMTQRFQDKYYWWCVSAGVFVVLLVCLGLAHCCHCLCSSCCGGSRRSRYGYDSDSDFDMDHFEMH